MTQSQFHENPTTYLSAIRSEVPRYDEFQDAIAGAVNVLAPRRILDLGMGTGETARRVLRNLPTTDLVGVDANAGMLRLASEALPDADLRMSRLEDPLPEGAFDAVFSGLAVHHLSADGKRDLFRRIAVVVRPGGRFVLGDVVVPEDPREAVTPLEPDVDRPDTLADQLMWLREAGLAPRVTWRADDLVVIAADQLD